MDCPDGYALVAGASEVQCKRFLCKARQCCELACSSFDCPNKFSPIKDADTTVCENSGCTKDLCCEKGKTSSEKKSTGLTRSWQVVTIGLDCEIRDVLCTSLWCPRRALPSWSVSIVTFSRKLPSRRDRRTPLIKPRLTTIYSLRQ